MTDIVERLYKPSEWRQARNAHKLHNPEPGDYWTEDHFSPVLVVLDVKPNFVVICDKTKDVGNNKWTWNLTSPTLISREEFVQKLNRYCSFSGSHCWAAKEYRSGKQSSESS